MNKFHAFYELENRLSSSAACLSVFMEVQNQQTKDPPEQVMWADATLQNTDIRQIQSLNMGPIKLQYTKPLFYAPAVFLKTWA
jgi:hypothetical protein